MPGRLDGKVAVITGGASGMGLATARRFLDEGARVVEDDVARAVRAAADHFGQLDVVFNNAGIGGAFGAVTDLHLEDWRYTFDVLVAGVFLGIKHGARQMIAQGWGGAIINTASVAGVGGGGGPLCYSAAKAAVLGLTRAAAVELAPHRIRVNAINPGTILTPLMHGGRPEQAADVMSRRVPWGAVGQPDDIAGAALFLAGEEAATSPARA